MKSKAIVLSILCVLSSGCSFVKPALIPPVVDSNTHVSRFHGTGMGTDDSEETRQAELCAGRLNGHANAANTAYGVRSTFSVIGAVLGGGGGGGGGLTAVLSTDSDTQKIGGYIAIAGGILGVVGAALGQVLTDPSARLDIRARALPYWSRALAHARELQRISPALDATERQRVHDQMMDELEACINDGVPIPATPSATPLAPVM